jgi:hypothetical protein
MSIKTPTKCDVGTESLALKLPMAIRQAGSYLGGASRYREEEWVGLFSEFERAFYASSSCDDLSIKSWWGF